VTTRGRHKEAHSDQEVHREPRAMRIEVTWSSQPRRGRTEEATASRNPFSWKSLRITGAFQQFRLFPVEGGFIQMVVNHVR
jgi:hypothetical protein